MSTIKILKGIPMLALALSFMLLASSLVCVSSVTAAGSVWTERTVYKSGAMFSCLEMDSNDRIHLTWFDNNGYLLKYATNSNPYGNWTVETVDSMGSFGSMDAMVLDTNDKVHIGYYDGLSHELRYATNMEGSFTTEVVESNYALAYPGNSIAVNATGRAFMSFVKSEQLYFATNALGGWNSESLPIPDWDYNPASLDVVIDPTDIAIGSDDVVHIIYRSYHYYSGNSTIMYYINHAWNSGSGWDYELVNSFTALVTVGIVHTYGALTVDGLGRPHFVYAFSEKAIPYNPRIYHTQRDASGWSTPYWVAGLEEMPTMPFMTLRTDPSNEVQLAYGDIPGIYHTTSAGGWATEKIVSTMGKGNRPGLGMDSNGELYVSFLGPGEVPGLDLMKYVTTASVPSEPWNLALTPGPGTIGAQWSAPNSTGSYPLLGYTAYIYQSEPVTSGADPIMTLGLPPGSTSYSFTGLANGNYWIGLTAGNSAGQSNMSAVIMVLVGDLPSAPAYLFASGYQYYVALSWYPPTYSNYSLVDGYSIMWGTSSGALTNEIVLGDVTSYQHNGLTAGQSYYYKVRAKNAMGWGPFTSVVTAQVIGAPPTIPLEVEAQSGDGWVKITWSPPASSPSSPVTQYKVFRGTVINDIGTVAFTQVSGSTLMYNDTSVTNGQTYYYAITASNEYGSSSLSDIVSATPEGPDNPPDDGGGGTDMTTILIIVGVVAVIAIIAAAYAMMRRRGGSP